MHARIGTYVSTYVYARASTYMYTIYMRIYTYVHMHTSDRCSRCYTYI